MKSETNGFIELDGGRMYYETAGPADGEPLVWVHAGFVDGRMWDEQWAEFRRDTRVVRFDMRGFGKSPAAAGPVARRNDLYRLLAHLEIGKARLVGCSMGGEIVLDFTLEHPEMVSALALVSSVPGGFELQGAPPPELFEMIAAVQSGDIERAQEMQMRLWIDGPMRQPGQADARVRERAAQMSRIALQNGTWQKMDGAPFQPLTPPAVQRLAEVRAPTLVMAGQLDNPEILRAAEVMLAEIPKARQVVLPDCAHLPNMEQPELFNRTLRNFLGE